MEKEVVQDFGGRPHHSPPVVCLWKFQEVAVG